MLIAPYRCCVRLTTKRKYRQRLQNNFSDKVEAFRFKNRTLPWRRNFFGLSFIPIYWFEGIPRTGVYARESPHGGVCEWGLLLRAAASVSLASLLAVVNGSSFSCFVFSSILLN